MLKRIFYGVLYSFFVIYFLYLNSTFATTLFLILISIIACKEIFNINEIPKLSIIFIATLVYMSLEIFSHYLSLKFPKIYTDAGAINFFVYTIIIFGIMLLNKDFKFKAISKIYLISNLITFAFNNLINLQNISGITNLEHIGNFWVLLTLLMAWSTDIGSYFCGIFFGKNKLCQEISPKKTVEGLIGGILCCILTLELTVFLAQKYIFINETIKINHVKFFIICLIGSLISAFGDLSFSFIKRNCHVKDFGKIIPGHGGILDRFDSVIFVAPYFYFVLKYLKIFT